VSSEYTFWKEEALLSSDWVDVRGVSGGNSDLLDRRKTKQLLVTGAVFDVTMLLQGPSVSFCWA
jgi:hypothetical protein